MTPQDQRIKIVRGLIPLCESLLDIGSGRVNADYPFHDNAERITCIDWNPRVDNPPKNVTMREGDFLNMEFSDRFDVILCADVFEHIPLEKEAEFVKKCLSLVNDRIVISVPHAGTFGWLDPFQVKPTLQRALWRCGLYKNTFNGDCDIRKGHKHYSKQELSETFAPLRSVECQQWGYFADPLYSWADGIRRKTGLNITAFVEKACDREYDRPYGDKSYNVAVAFEPMTAE